jgi:hypothetical protein
MTKATKIHQEEKLTGRKSRSAPGAEISLGNLVATRRLAQKMEGSASLQVKLEKTVATGFEDKPEKTVTTGFEDKPTETVATGFESKPVKTI